MRLARKQSGQEQPAFSKPKQLKYDADHFVNYPTKEVAIDFIRTSWEEKGLPWEKAKSFDGAAVIGDWINISQFKNVDSISFSLRKNDDLVQQGNTSHMLWKIDEIIEYVSKYFTLKIGDIIFTGTPSGVSKVVANDKLLGFIEDRQMFSIKVK